VVLRAQQSVLAGEVDLLGDAGRGGGEQGHVDRLDHEVLGTELHRAHRGLDIALAGEQDDRGAARAQLLQHVEAAGAGEVEIQDHHLGPEPLVRLQSRLASRFARHLIAEALEVVADGPQHVRVIVDEEQRVSHGAS